MTLATAVEFARLQATTATTATSAPARGLLSPRESELVTLVAGGRTDGQIADELFISVRTVRSHLDRIRDNGADISESGEPPCGIRHGAGRQDEPQRAGRCDSGWHPGRALEADEAHVTALPPDWDEYVDNV